MQKPIILHGKSVAEKIEEELKVRIQQLTVATNKKPKLVTILVGDFLPSVTYVNMKIKACQKVGIIGEVLKFKKSITTHQLINEIKKLNADDSVHGILIQHPLPKSINEQKCFDSIAVEKDVDGVSSFSFGKMCNQETSFVAATPLGIITLLKEYNIAIASKHAVVVGRSAILGKPVAMQLLNENATVTITHSKTNNLKDILKQADIVVAALGKPNYIKSNWLKQGVVLIDAGYNEGNVGDIDLDNASKIASAYTPVPGGVGPMTIASLLTQTVQSFENYLQNKK